MSKNELGCQVTFFSNILLTINFSAYSSIICRTAGCEITGFLDFRKPQNGGGNPALDF